MSALIVSDRPVRLARGRSLLGTLGPALALGAAVLVIWQLAVTVGGVGSYLLPAPTTIIRVLFTDAPTLLTAARPTATAIVSAVIVGTVIGLVISVVVAMFEGLARVVLTLVALAGCAPIVALAPIFNAWFGSTSLVSKVAVATICVAIPVIVNTTRGLLTVEPIHREYLQSLSGSRWQLLWFVRLPGAMPSLFDGLRIGATLAVIAVIVSEYFGGTAKALGVMIANTAATSQFAQTWAAVAIASLIGLALYAIVALLEYLTVPWRRAAAR